MKSVIKYGRDSLSLDDGLGASRSRDLKIKVGKKKQMVKVDRSKVDPKRKINLNLKGNQGHNQREESHVSTIIKRDT